MILKLTVGERPYRLFGKKRIRKGEISYGQNKQDFEKKMGCFGSYHFSNYFSIYCYQKVLLRNEVDDYEEFIDSALKCMKSGEKRINLLEKPYSVYVK